MGMEERDLDFVLVPVGLAVVAVYHGWLLFTICRHPKRTVIGLNALARRRWVSAMMSDPLKHGVLAVQTLRNNIMASTVLATTAITITSLIGVFVGVSSTGTPSSPSPSSRLVYGNKAPLASSVKFFAISLCFILAFLCNVQSIRYYAHVSFLLAVPPAPVTTTPRAGGTHLISVSYAARSLNRGSFFWSLGLRAFYVSFNLFLWIFGPIPMLASCLVMVCLLYFLDTTTALTREIHECVTGDLEMKEQV